MVEIFIQCLMGEESAKLNSNKVKNLLPLQYLLDILMLQDNLLDLNESSININLIILKSKISRLI